LMAPSLKATPTADSARGYGSCPKMTTLQSDASRPLRAAKVFSRDGIVAEDLDLDRNLVRSLGSWAVITGPSTLSQPGERSSSRARADAISRESGGGFNGGKRRRVGVVFLCLDLDFPLTSNRRENTHSKEEKTRAKQGRRQGQGQGYRRRRRGWGKDGKGTAAATRFRSPWSPRWRSRACQPDPGNWRKEGGQDG